MGREDGSKKTKKKKRVLPQERWCLTTGRLDVGSRPHLLLFWQGQEADSQQTGGTEGWLGG